MFSRPKILFLVSLLFVALLNPKFNPYLLFKFLIFYHSSLYNYCEHYTTHLIVCDDKVELVNDEDNKDDDEEEEEEEEDGEEEGEELEDDRRRRYERDFLLSLQFLEQCKQRPPNLMNAKYIRKVYYCYNN